jgi:2,3-bisphosphoglycerate-dependent phosphoglycerate mutase
MENHLIVAHSNSLRAIIKILDQLSPEKIMEVNIPTGIPLIYELSDKLEVISKKYLIDDDTLAKKNKAIIKQGTKNG